MDLTQACNEINRVDTQLKALLKSIWSTPRHLPRDFRRVHQNSETKDGVQNSRPFSLKNGFVCSKSSGTAAQASISAYRNAAVLTVKEARTPQKISLRTKSSRLSRRTMSRSSPSRTITTAGFGTRL